MNENARRIMRDRRMRGGDRDMTDRRDRDMERRDGHHHGGYGEYEGSYRGTYERDHRGRDYGDPRYMDDRRDRGDMRRDRGEDYRGRDYGDREDYRDRGGYPRNERGEFKDRRGRDYGEDYRRDYADDYRRDYGEEEDVKLDRETLRKWGEMLRNADGSKGLHFKEGKIREAAKSLKMSHKGYTEDELEFVANMLYSDYCDALRHLIPSNPENEAMAYAKLAHAWLSDEDAPKGSEKLALYYYCIIEQDDE